MSHLTSFLAGHRQCRLVPRLVDVVVVETGLCKNIYFDADSKRLLDELREGGEVEYPPRNIAEADAMYTFLREGLEARQEHV